MKWRRHKFTFMVIPDEANKQVVRFQLSGATLLSTLILLVVLAVTAAASMVMYGKRANEVGRLQQELASSTGQYEKIISDKDRHIGDLQTEVAGLSDQAKKIQNKMADIHKLESQLKKIAGIPNAGSASGTKASADNQDAYAMDGEGTGGEELPVTDEEIDGLLLQTTRDFSDIAGMIDEMKPRLEQTKDAVLNMQNRLRVTPTIWPADSRKITSPFGVRRDPFTHRARFHAGLDISGDIGDPIYAAADGMVTHTGYDGSHGNNVMILHGNGIATHYSHLSKILVKPGTKVRKGDLIAEMGSTGRSTGPHLHYEVYVGGKQVDPQPYLQNSREDIRP
ncbi:M23 family metallopeptidase [Cohnella sp. CFH 77786]|uniref:M23 family metallopeptidase n=1 Tax=Cohnella sp. CFH 77786 TaxID=2662265 RepID=UPI001C608A6F|nr:M23 family metallopeptidase [Cohnella sp. CFH 77786]